MSLPNAVVELLKRPPEAVRIAVIGASNDPRKFGNIIFRDLERKGYPVVPVNPAGGEVLGHEVVPTPAQLQGSVAILDFVVPPAVSLAVLDDVEKDRYEVLWFQPGSFDARVVEKAKTLAANVVAGPCIMVET